MPDSRQNAHITKFILNVVNAELENALHGTDWQDLLDEIVKRFDMEEIYPVAELEQWAIEHGYTKVKDNRPDPLGEALNSGDGSYRP